MPIMASTSSMGTISMASHGQPSRKAPSGPLLTHFLQPMQSSGVDLDVAEGRMVLVRDPVHAIGHRAIRNAGRRSGASGAALGDDCKFFGPFLPRGGDPLGFRLHLDDGRCHAKNYDTKARVRSDG